MRRVSYQTCQRKKLQEDSKQYPNPIKFQCNLCTKHLAFDQVGSLCLKEGCIDCFCTSCTLAQRTGHRHYLYEFTVMRSPKNYLNQVSCNYCAKPVMVAMAQGLWCSDCNKHFLCISCIVSAGKTGVPKLEEGLPHMKIMKPCKVKNGWQLYVMEGA
ncbi:hypothetical protein K458DRAFT_116657 [Lentithecium fluviatile CBS 122367]|uniref:Uncharacterized protein n=1 Tax=Lentithecium fluviatile CBS 122367 TaxID=1168545 RepID=A0A6G1IMY5_9PLEO|nr:hypothetical protein K458DRAFT_116657 [Lentithecium fluviatile CBS 122367]